MTLPLDLVHRHEVVLCLGSGGVGKTTTAAALAVMAAERGRRVVVLTIDPARRLADAMGLTDGEVVQRGRGLGKAGTNEAVPVGGPWAGELWAAMLDPSETFDDLIRQETASDEQAQRILDNRLYRNLTTSLSGTSEYMAAERLRSLAGDDRFDLVIVDTPPSRHAFDFLDSPARLVRFFDHRLYQAILAPRQGVFRAVSSATQLLLRAVSRLVGSALLQDVVDFFAAFEGIDQGFRNRAEEVSELLVSPGTAYVVVTAPATQPLREAQWISENLAKRARGVALVVVNRMVPVFGVDDPDGLDAVERRVIDELDAVATREASVVDDLVNEVRADTVLALHEQAEPVTDLDGLGRLAEELAGAEYD